MSNPQLTQYIQTQRAAGVSDDVIRQVLLNSGWLQGDVDEAFSSLVSVASTVPVATIATAVPRHTSYIP
jgi:hypothetical protein